MFKKILLFLLLVLVIIQFIHPKRNKTSDSQPNYVGNVFPVPSNIQLILKKACLDCHSNNTVYPWYCNFQPFDWFTNNHIKNGKKGMNLDEFTNRSLRYQYTRFGDIVEQIKKDEMPLNSYLWIHKDAILTQDEKNLVINWANAARDTMKAKYPIDSLQRKKSS